MTPERYRKICEVCDKALYLAPAERAALLATACPDNESRAEVERLLAAVDAADRAGFLEEPCPTVAEVGDQQDDRRIGQVIDSHKILRRIGRGGMGVVYEARQEKLNRSVALKMIRAGHLADAVDIMRLREEAEVLAHLDHPNIVPVYEVGEIEGQPYFIMKLIEGESLSKQIDRFRADPSLAARLLAATANAVHHAHQAGVLHRDLKPSNILVDTKDQPHVTDFGLAKRLGHSKGDTLTETGAVLGSPPYMAPEQAAGAKALSTAADVYGLGAILYELITGQALQGETPLEVLIKVRTTEPEPPHRRQPDCPSDLETICLKCLEKEPNLRYASAADLSDDLLRFVNHEPIRARPASTRERFVRWTRRNRAAVTVIGVLFLGIAMSTTAAVFAWIQRDRAIAAVIQSNLEAGQRALLQGNLREAVSFRRLAVENGYRETPDFRFGTLKLRIILEGYHEVARDLQELALDPGMRDHMATIAFYRGESKLDGRNDAEGKELLQLALKGDLSEADRWYVNALLAKTSSKVLEFCDMALKHDHLHRAAILRCSVLLLLGRIDDAKGYLDSPELPFPGNEILAFDRAIVEGLRGNKARSLEILQELRERATVSDLRKTLPSQSVIFESYDPTYFDTGKYLQKGSLKDEAARWFLITRFLSPLVTSYRTSQSVSLQANGSDGHDRLPMPTHFRELFAELGKLYFETSGLMVVNDHHIDRLSNLLGIHEEGTLCHIHACWLFDRARGYRNHPGYSKEKYRELMTQALAAFKHARKTPSIFPVQAPVLEGLALAESCLSLDDAGEVHSESARDAVAHIEDRLMLRPPLSADRYHDFCEIALNGRALGLAGYMLERWKRLQPDDLRISSMNEKLTARSPETHRR